MPKKVRFKTNVAGHFDVRRMPTMVALIEGECKKKLDAANATLENGDGYRMSSGQGRKKPQGRWAARVYTFSNEAKRSNARNNTLHRVLSGG